MKLYEFLPKVHLDTRDGGPITNKSETLSFSDKKKNQKDGSNRPRQEAAMRI